jgi:hypothetical protein
VSYLVGSNLQKNPIFFLSLSLFQIFIHWYPSVAKTIKYLFL